MTGPDQPLAERQETQAQKSEATAAQAMAYVLRKSADAREELNRADTKAAILLAGASAVIAALLSASAPSGRPLRYLDVAVQLLWWGSAAVAGLAVALLGAAIYPRVRRTGPSPPATAYFADIAAYRDIASLHSAVYGSAADELSELVGQLWRVSRIVAAKYRMIALGLWSLLIAALGCCLALGLQLVTI